MSDVFKKLFSFLSAREKKRFYILVGIMLLVSFSEIVGISTIFVLLNVLTTPSIIQENAYLAWMYDTFEVTSVSSFQVYLTAGVFIAIVLSLMIKAAGTYAIIRYSKMRGYMISKRLFEAYLHQPYSWFLERNSSDISKTVLNEAERLVRIVLIPALQMLASSALAIGLFVFLMLIEPIVAMTATLVISGGYLSIYLVLRGRLTRYGREMVDANSNRFRMTQEATGGFRELKLLGLEDHYVKRYEKPARHFASLFALVQVMRDMPKFALEALTYGVLLAAILYLQLKNDGDLTAAIPVLGTFAFAVMRMLPAVQQIYNGITSMRNGSALLNDIHSDYQSARAQSAKGVRPKKTKDTLALSERLSIQRATFCYANASRPALDGLSISIPAKSTVGIVGGTGAGKTTLVDVILGLLTLDFGEIRVDDTQIDRNNIQAWRNSVGYVPQTIYLTDTSVAENIAFGVEPENIDMNAVERAAKAAALHEFVTTELPNSYQTVVGERGVRLSGGQRQRIGIARALYKDPEVLILDEATSALDNLTERAVMDAVHNIGHQKTIIMIAHRLTTVRDCDQIFLLENGVVAEQGRFQELVEKSASFRDMASSLAS